MHAGNRRVDHPHRSIVGASSASAFIILLTQQLSLLSDGKPHSHVGNLNFDEAKDRSPRSSRL
jgi:hypothetical protein